MNPDACVLQSNLLFLLLSCIINWYWHSIVGDVHRPQLACKSRCISKPLSDFLCRKVPDQLLAAIAAGL